MEVIIQHKSLWKEVHGYNENLKTAGDDVDYSNRVNKLNKYKTFYKSVQFLIVIYKMTI